MTRTGPAKKAGDGASGGRLENARAYRQQAEQLLILADERTNTNPIQSLVVSATIAYCDALTAKFAGVVNKQDHKAAAKQLRAALGNQLPREQEQNLLRILDRKDEVQYGIRVGRKPDADALVQKMQSFGDWAEGLLGIG